MNISGPVHDQVIGWLFPAGVTTHVLLVAGLRNPTVRRRYVAARDLLANYGELDFYERLLELLGCARMSRARVACHLAALTEVFDAAKAVIETPFSFASDISDVARPIAIDGSRELIEHGLHREAVFWIAATHSRCRKVLFADAPATRQRQFDAAYWELLGDLGIASFADLQNRERPLATPRGSVESIGYRAATVRKRVLPRAASLAKGLAGLLLNKSLQKAALAPRHY